MYKELKNAQFQECANCASKSGTPILCEACLHNRTLVGELQRALRKVISKYKKQKQKNKKNGKMR